MSLNFVYRESMELFSFADAIPPSAAALVVYISLVRIFSPFAACRLKKNWPFVAVLRMYLPGMKPP